MNEWMVLHGDFYCVKGSSVDVHELASMVMAVNDIWSQAHIRFSFGVDEFDSVPHWPSPLSGDPTLALDRVSEALAIHTEPTVINSVCDPRFLRGMCPPH